MAQLRSGSPDAPECEVEDCRRPAAPLPPKPGRGPRHNRWCWTHLWRRRARKPLREEIRPYRQSRTERLVEAAYALLETKDREGVLRAKDRLRKAGEKPKAAKR